MKDLHAKLVAAYGQSRVDRLLRDVGYWSNYTHEEAVSTDREALTLFALIELVSYHPWDKQVMQPALSENEVYHFLWTNRQQALHTPIMPAPSLTLLVPTLSWLTEDTPPPQAELFGESSPEYAK